MLKRLFEGPGAACLQKHFFARSALFGSNTRLLAGALVYWRLFRGAACLQEHFFLLRAALFYLRACFLDHLFAKGITCSLHCALL